MFYFHRNIDENVLLTFYFGLLQTSNLNPYKTIKMNPYFNAIGKCVYLCLKKLRTRFINVLLRIFENVYLKLLQNIYELIHHFWKWFDFKFLFGILLIVFEKLFQNVFKGFFLTFPIIADRKQRSLSDRKINIC